jgi:integrase
MNRERLTLERIKRFTCSNGKRQDFLWDSEMPRLAVRATAAGAKAFIFETKLERKTIRVTIGDAVVWTLEAARNEARRLQTLVDTGNDPRIAKAEKLAETAAKQEAARCADMPALEVWHEYIEARRARWSDKHLADHEKVSKEGGEPRTRGRRPGESDKTLPGILRPLLLLPLEQIDADLVQSWLHEEAAKRPTHARLAFGLLRAFLNWCSDSPKHRDCTHSDACTARLAKNELPKKAAKNDCMQREQLPAWFASVKQIGNPVVSSYLQAALLTGARREELSFLTWENVDFQWKAITIKDKIDGERTIPLTPYVASLLAALPRRNEWVFSSPAAESGRLQEPRIGHNKALSAAGLPELSIHGLRRSFGTLAEWVECPAGVSAQIMGHKPSATAEKHYRVRPLDLLRMWHTKIEGWILEQAGIQQPAEDAKPGLRVINA